MIVGETGGRAVGALVAVLRIAVTGYGRSRGWKVGAHGDKASESMEVVRVFREGLERIRKGEGEVPLGRGWEGGSKR